MKKKILAVGAVALIAAFLLFGGRVDCSKYTEPEDYYQLTMEECASLLGQYMHKHGKFQIRGTMGYDDAIGELRDDAEFNSTIESAALKYYIDAYQGANVDSKTKFTIHRIPKAIAGRTVQEYVYGWD